MQIGFNAPTSGPLIDPDSLSRIIAEGEALGFDYVTISDHIMVPRNLEFEISLYGHRRVSRRNASRLVGTACDHRLYRCSHKEAALRAVGNGRAAPSGRANG